MTDYTAPSLTDLAGELAEELQIPTLELLERLACAGITLAPDNRDDVMAAYVCAVVDAGAQ
jgi:hypothetical protein